LGAEPSFQSFERTLANCTSCHGKNGQSADSHIPNLRAQNYDYLVNQLVRFAHLQPGSSVPGEGSEVSPIVRSLESIRNRRSEIMEQHTGTASDAVVRDLARYFSKLPCGATPTQAPARTQPKGTAWCNDCHAVKTVRRTTNVPLLHGQHADYLEAQLLAFKRAASDANQEDARLHHFMSRSVRTMSEGRLREVAEYYAAQSCTK
jgi:cytochrome c553